MQKANPELVAGDIVVSLKLYASLSAFLPANAVQNVAEVGVAEGTTVLQLLDGHNVPREMSHLVLVNGIFQSPEARETLVVKTDDHVAVWPPVAGG